MNPTDRKRRARLRQTALAVADLLDEDEISAISLWERPDITREHTEGYAAEIGTLRGSPLRIEIWLDRFSGSRDDRYYAGFTSGRRKPIEDLVAHAPARWASKRLIAADEISSNGRVRLLNPLQSNEFSMPVVEYHFGGSSFFGFYDPSDPKDATSSEYFIRLAVTFFVDMTNAYTTPSSRPERPDVDPDDYVGVDRYRVLLHARHERNSRAAKACKERDRFACQVCNFVFEDLYGELGQEFAEAHHLTPLGGLKRDARTKTAELVTVCANCHRMLHRMKGKRGDVATLVRIVARHRGRG